MIELIKYSYRGFRMRYKVDTNELNYIVKNINEGDVVLDIGAHKGGYLYWMEKAVKKKGKVYAFEPQVKLFNYLKGIVKLKKYSNVTIENLGLSSEEGEVSFFIPKNEKGVSPSARIGHLDDGTTYDEAKIKITTLDKYFFDRNIQPSLLKIDVEGHEKQVLLGGINLLKLAKPKIVMECENRHLKEGNVFDVFAVLIDLGYSGFFFQENELKPLANFDPEKHQKIKDGNILDWKNYVNNFVFEFV